MTWTRSRPYELSRDGDHAAWDFRPSRAKWGAKLPSVFLPETRERPVLAGHGRTTTKGLRPANVLVRGPFRFVAGAGFEPA